MRILSALIVIAAVLSASPASLAQKPKAKVSAKAGVVGGHTVTLNYTQGAPKAGSTCPAGSGSTAITSNNIYRATTSGGEGTIGGTPAPVPYATVMPAAVQFVDQNVTNGATYFYTVTAVNCSGESAMSGESNAALIPNSMPPNPPGTPNATTAQVFDINQTPPACFNTTASSFTFSNFPMGAAQAGTFQITWSETPTLSTIQDTPPNWSTATTDGVWGLSSGPVTAYGQLSAIIRANPSTGYFDAYNGTGYGVPLVQIKFTHTAYRLSLTVNVPAQTYSAYVNGTEIAANYKFRAPATTLSNIGAVSETGSLALCPNLAL
jgi:hypothetical protein